MKLKGRKKMAMRQNSKIYGQCAPTGTFELKYGVSYSTFNALKTCGLTKENGANINGKPVDAYLSTWLVQGEDLDFLLSDPCEEAYTKKNPAFGDKLCGNLVLLGLNPGSMDTMTEPWHFFHKRWSKDKVPVLVEMPSEKYLKEYLTELELPFEGAYMTDIVKFQDTENNLYIEPNSGKLELTDDAMEHNFKILRNELALLRESAPTLGNILLVPIGRESESYLKKYLAWLPAQQREMLNVPPNCMAHYSQAGWNSKNSKALAQEMKTWCEQHIIGRT